MNEIQKNHKYFINDTEVTTNKDDKFKHDDIAKNIVSIIENYEPSYNIAVVGKWGIGKSSLINMVKEKLKPNENYKVLEVNAWKYEKEALKRILLRKSLANLGYSDEGYIDKLYSYIGGIKETPKLYCDKLRFELIPLIMSSLIICVLGITFATIGHIILSYLKGVGFNIVSLTDFILNNLVTSFYVPIFIVLLDKYINTSSGKYNFQVVPPITTTDEYEIILENKINELENKDTFIIIVDDLDRLTPNKIVEALDAIKAFVGYKNFIFIVPFDETILKDAIQREKTKFRNNEHLAIESDLFLDKLFQHRIFLPSTIQSDMPTYAIEMARNDAKDLVKLCGDEEFELICKEILIHKKVSTPRQAKKIINTFANNLLLGYRREEKDVEKGVFTSNKSKRYIAKISVLQCDFSNFYTSLFVDNNLINEFLDSVKTSYVVVEDRESSEDCGLVGKDINELLVPYFDKEDNKYKLNKTGESLFMFLNRTSNIEFENININRYLYLDDDRLSHLFGNEFSSSIREYLTSGVYQLVKESIQQNLDKDIGLLLYEILTNSDPMDFEICCIGIINLTEIDTIFNDSKLLNSVNDKLEVIFNRLDTINSIDLELTKAIEIYGKYNDFNGFDKLILNELKKDEENLEDILNVFFEYESLVSDNIKQYVINDIISVSETENGRLSLDELLETKLIDIDLYFDDYLSKLGIFIRMLKELDENNTDANSNKAISFVKLFENHAQKGDANEVLNIVKDKMNDSYFSGLLIESIFKYASLFTDIEVTSIVRANLIKCSDDIINDTLLKILSHQ